MADSTATPPSASQSAPPAPDPNFRAVVARLVGAAAESLTFEPLSGGVSSDIWRVGHGADVFCAKRALPRLRVAALFDALRIDPFFRHIEDRFDGLAALVRDLETSRSTLVHGDFSPKNMLVDAGGQIRILDAETATWGPAAFDPGYLIAHLLLKFERAMDPRLLDTAGRFWTAYSNAIQSIAGTAAAPTDRDVVRVIAGMLLARIDGKSPVDYLTETARESLRQRAANLLAQSTVSLDAHATVHDLLLRWPPPIPKSS